MTYKFNIPVECYGHGKWLREWIGWPEWIPFPAYSDHGVSLDSYHATHELENEYLLHFYWSEYKKTYSFQKRPYSFKKFIQVPHPYLTLKSKKFKFCNANREGLLVFWPHTTPGYTYSTEYINTYIEYLNTLRNTYSPINVCIAFIDLDAPWVIRLKETFNIVTAGHPLAEFYPENLFTLIDSHAYATSPLEGSQIAYCTLLGVKYFINGPIPVYQNIGDKNIPKGDGLNRSMIFNSLFENQKNLFSIQNLDKWADKVAFVEPLLGVSANPNRTKLRFYLLLELIRLLLMTNHGSMAIVHYSKTLRHQCHNLMRRLMIEL